MSNDLVVVDISHYQPEPDWQALKGAGIVGVILKATEGTSYVDPTFDWRWTAAEDAGLAVSSYHFLHHGSIQDQMEHYLNVVQPGEGERLVIDFEDQACDVADLQQAIELLWESDEGYELTVYGGSSFLKDCVKGCNDVLRQTSLWIAHYTSAAQPSWPTETWPTWSLWQYTDSARVAGIDGPVDGNRFNGSKENAALWIGPATLTPAPAGELGCHVNIQADDGVHVSVAVNGQLILA